jgi:ferredoxin
MIAGQVPYLWGKATTGWDDLGIPAWGIFLQPVGFLCFFAAAFAETKRAPFDVPEGESEIIGYFVEYSGMKFGLFMISEFAEVVILAAITTALFFGGWSIGFGFDSTLTRALTQADLGWLLGAIYATIFWVKVLVLCYVQLAIRWTFPRFRYDQIQSLGWKILLPLALANIFVTGALVLVDPTLRWLAVFGLLEIGFPSSPRRSDRKDNRSRPRRRRTCRLRSRNARRRRLLAPLGSPDLHGLQGEQESDHRPARAALRPRAVPRPGDHHPPLPPEPLQPDRQERPGAGPEGRQPRRHGQLPRGEDSYPPGYRGLTGWCRARGRHGAALRGLLHVRHHLPAQCIYIEAGEYETTDPSADNRVIEKYPTQFVIDELRCIVCGFCVDACPKDAIRMDTGLHTPSEYNRQGFIWDIPKLLQGPPVSHPSDPWNKRESSRPPPHQHLEPHTRIGEGLTPLKLPASGQEPHARTVVTDQPVPVTRFLKE